MVFYAQEWSYFLNGVWLWFLTDWLWFSIIFLIGILPRKIILKSNCHILLVFYQCDYGLRAKEITRAHFLYSFFFQLFYIRTKYLLFPCWIIYLSSYKLYVYRLLTNKSSVSRQRRTCTKLKQSFVLKELETRCTLSYERIPAANYKTSCRLT